MLRLYLAGSGRLYVQLLHFRLTELSDSRMGGNWCEKLLEIHHIMSVCSKMSQEIVSYWLL